MNVEPSPSLSTLPASADRSLVRGLGLFDATMIVVGSMIGSGVFITSSEAVRYAGSPGLLLAAWAIAGLLTITGALCCGELAAMMPHAGGQYVFFREAYGPAVAFLFGWATFLVIQTGTIAAVAVAFAKFLGVFIPAVSAGAHLIRPIPLGPHYAICLSTQQLAAIAVIALLTFTNTRGINIGKWIQNTFTLAKTAALAALIVIGLAAGRGSSSAFWTASWWSPGANGWSPASAQPGLGVVGSLAIALLLGKAMIGPLFSQTAWNNITFTGGEVKNPGGTIPLGLLLGCGIVVILYLLANLTYICTLSLSEIEHASEGRVATAVMKKVLGEAGVYAMAGAILVSTFGCLNGLILAGSRVYYAMAGDGLFFAFAAKTNAKRTPANAVVAGGLWSIALTLPATVVIKNGKPVYGNVYNQLLEYIVPSELMLYMLMAASVIVLRIKAPGALRPFKIPLFPWPALVYLAISLCLVCDQAYLSPKTSGIGFAIVLAGVPVYFARRWFGARKKL